MTKHSKNNTASSIFSYAERKKLDYGTKGQRLGNESMRRFDACALCLQRARDPVACQEGHLFCKECAYTDLLTQKKDIKRQKERKARAKEAARERVLAEFERGQLGLATIASVTTSGAEVPGRGTKRKFSFDSTAAEKVAQEAEEAALRQIEREQAAALRSKLPDFWLPSLTPTYTSSGPPSSLADVKVQTTCRGGNPPHPIVLKNLIPVNFTWQSQSSLSQSADTTPAGGGVFKQKDEEKNAVCPSCKKALSNSVRIYVMKTCSHVTCKTCTEALVRPANQCVVCDKKLAKGDVLELQREGTGYASGGMAETKRTGVAFQG
ncbi:hypothetical protein B0F90DRAFT_1701358 [Multifurca ochricompacta]|uniref:RING-type domain-containing protein n=1 Tax=Multifurca ochricompacta TaxID=376703 RepID=A0AAD4M778_9AGAM|nr:hypothetical protein B0F90DRAFT_1701358 [Multifurca ochricompacta]